MTTPINRNRALTSLRQAIASYEEFERAFDAICEAVGERRDDGGWVNDAVFVWSGSAEQRLDRLIEKLREERKK